MKLKRSDDVIISKIRISHSRLTHSYILKGEHQPECDCPLIIQHTFLECSDTFHASLTRKRSFHWISMKSRLVKGDRETSIFQNWLYFTNSRRRYLPEILPIRRKTLSNQSINQSMRHLSRTRLTFYWLIGQRFTPYWQYFRHVTVTTHFSEICAGTFYKVWNWIYCTVFQTIWSLL